MTIELDPENATAYFMKGEVLDKRGRCEEAKAAYHKAHELDPAQEIPDEYR